jgi:DNA-binding NarL/FixJ family response regulator
MALDLIGDRPDGVGYLLKERVGDVDAFIDAVKRIATGGSVLDPEVVGHMLGRRTADGPLAALTPREREVLAAMAEGKSNQGIAEALFVTAPAVEKHVTSIFHKLGLGQMPSEHRRVHAVLMYLRSSPG